MVKQSVTWTQLLVGVVLGFLTLLVFFPTQNLLVLLALGGFVIVVAAVGVRWLARPKSTRSLSTRARFVIGNALLAFCCFGLLWPTLFFIFGLWLLRTQRPLDVGVLFLILVSFGLSAFSGYYLIRITLVLLLRIQHKEDLLHSIAEAPDSLDPMNLTGKQER